MDYSLLIGIHDLDQGDAGKIIYLAFLLNFIFQCFLERDRTISGGDMNTSDLSGNESTDGSGMKFRIILQILNA
jgi:hypothetical protein